LTNVLKLNNGTQLPCGVGMLQSKTVPSVKTVSTRLVLNARRMKFLIMRAA